MALSLENMNLVTYPGLCVRMKLYQLYADRQIIQELNEFNKMFSTGFTEYL